MIKPLWALTGIALLGTAGVVGAVVVASSGGEEEILQQVETPTPTGGGAKDPRYTPTPTSAVETTPVGTPAACDPNPSPAPGTQLWRWGDVVLTVDEESRAVIGRGAAAEEPVMEVVVADEDGTTSNLVLDAKDGHIISDNVDAKHRSEIDEILGTRMICLFDPAAAPWPYSAEPNPGLKEERFGSFVFMRPDPAAGIEISVGIAEGGIGEFLEVSNGRSQIFLYEYQGRQNTPGTIHPDDRSAFERFAQSVETCGVEASC